MLHHCYRYSLLQATPSASKIALLLATLYCLLYSIHITNTTQVKLNCAHTCTYYPILFCLASTVRSLSIKPYHRAYYCCYQMLQVRYHSHSL